MERTYLPHFRPLNHEMPREWGPRCLAQLSAGPGMEEPYADRQTQRWKRRNIQSSPEDADGRCEGSCGNNTLVPLLISWRNGAVDRTTEQFVLEGRSVKIASPRNLPNDTESDWTLPMPRGVVFCGVYGGRGSTASSADGEGDGSGWAGG